MKAAKERRRNRFFMHGSRLALTMLLGLWGCAPTRSVIPVLADRNDITLLVGEWSGTYTSAAGSSGTISFILAAGTDSAFGEVVMLDDHFQPAPVPSPYPLTPEDHLVHKQVLKIRFIRLLGDRVSGELASYFDPVSGCAMTTIFEGSLRQNEIRGSFVSRFVGTLETHSGTWRVTRQTLPDAT